MSTCSIHHVCIQTGDYGASLDFYTRILGYSVVIESPNFHGRDYNTWLKRDGFMIELQTPKTGESLREWSKDNSGPVHLGFLVDDARAEYARIKALGYSEFKTKNGEDFYYVKGTALFKVKAPEGTEIEFRDSDISTE
jgi:glyoxylase I family protein